MSRTPAAIVTAIRQNLMDASASNEVAGRVVEFAQRAQRELEDSRLSPIQHAVLAGTPSALSTLVATKPADWLGVRIDFDTDPIVAPHYLTGDGAVKYLLAPYFTDVPEVIRERFGYADNILSYPDLVVLGAPQIIALDETGGLNPTGGTTATIRCFPHTDGLNSVGAFDASGLYPIRVPYWRSLAAFDGAAANWWTQNADYYLEWSATAHGLIANRDLSAAAPYISQAAGEIERLRDNVRQGRLPRVITIRQRGYAIGTPALRVRRIREDL